MLILSRKSNESIIIDGRIVIKILRIEKDTVKLGIQAPPEVSVHRQEIQDLIDKGRTNGAVPHYPAAPRLAVPAGAGENGRHSAQVASEPHG